MPNDSSSPSQPARFGHQLLPEFCFEPGFVALNNGSYGSVPKPVKQYCRDLQDEIEGGADKFIRRTLLPPFTECRQRVADLVKADLDDLVFVPNASHGVNTILRNLTYKPDDVLIAYSTSYGSVLQTLRYLCDANPGVTLEVIPLEFPECTHEEILKRTDEVVKKYNKKRGEEGEAGGRVKMVMIDGMSSMPGVVMPWRGLAALARNYGALSVVDGAHLVGHLPLDLSPLPSGEPLCDFLVSNTHKWLMSQRSTALMWVPKQNQHLIRTTFPVGFVYESTKYPGTGAAGEWLFAKQFEWTSTLDPTPYLSIAPALDFRASLGGELAITSYCHELAVKGGEKLLEVFGGKEKSLIMENDKGELTANMVNVALPLPPFSTQPPSHEKAVLAAQLRFMEDYLFAANCFAAVYAHNGRWWVRASAQVWVELSDFEYVGQVLVRACREIEDGSWEKGIDDGDVEEVAKEGLVTDEKDTTM